MESRVKLFGHPIHPMLIVFPLGLLGMAVIFDIVRLATGSAYWADISYWMIASGLVGGALAAVFGLVDFLAIPKDTRARRIGAIHGVGNAVVMVLFGLSFLMRHSDLQSVAPIGLSIAGAGLALVTGWLGGELVDRLAVGVDDNAHLNAPSSLSDRPAKNLS